MDNRSQIHKAEVAILYQLRHTQSSRFSVLMEPTGLESDVFKFHIRKLVKFGYIEKNDNGHYRLTAIGKEYANNLDRYTKSIQKQPKLSTMLIITKTDKLGQQYYLLQKRMRNPYMGYWGFLSGPVKWGDNIEQTAQNEFFKQTALEASFGIKLFYRERVYSANELIEDKLFAAAATENPRGIISNAWNGGV